MNAPSRVTGVSPDALPLEEHCPLRTLNGCHSHDDPTPARSAPRTDGCIHFPASSARTQVIERTEPVDHPVRRRMRDAEQWSDLASNH